jgi:hypothetical protein
MKVIETQGSEADGGQRWVLQLDILLLLRHYRYQHRSKPWVYLNKAPHLATNDYMYSNKAPQQASYNSSLIMSCSLMGPLWVVSKSSLVLSLFKQGDILTGH